MALVFGHSRYMPCTECGASVETSAKDRHVCDRERLLDYVLFQLRGEVAAFDDALRSFLESPEGRFAQWLAERDRRRPPG